MRPAIILLALTTSFASGQERSELLLAPSRPVPGRLLTIQYRPTTAFVPARSESVVVEILAAGPEMRVHDVTLRRSSGMYTGSWTPPARAEALVLRVAVGERVDDRHGDGWATPVDGFDGAPGPRSLAWLARAGAPGGLYGFRARIDGLSAGGGPEPVDERTSSESDWRAAVQHRDASERWSALKEYLEEYPDATDEAKVQVLVRSAIAAEAWDDADALIHRQPRKEPLWLIALADGLMRANVTLDRASVLAKESVNASRNWDPALKPPTLSLREFRLQRASEVPLALRTYARSLVKLGYPAIAEKVYAEVFELLDGKDPDVHAAYVAVLRQLGKEEKAREVLSAIR